jgi:hypothetical protein
VHSVEYYELIRRKHFADGMSLRAVAKELGHPAGVLGGRLGRWFFGQRIGDFPGLGLLAGEVGRLPGLAGCFG